MIMTKDMLRNTIILLRCWMIIVLLLGSFTPHSYWCAAASENSIIDYIPLTAVTDDAAIDLDQRILERELSKGTQEGRNAAYRIYTDGAYSEPYAVLTLKTNLTLDVPAGLDVTGMANDGQVVQGKTVQVATTGSNILKVKYQVHPIHSDYATSSMMCFVGGNPDPQLDRCLTSSGALEIESMAAMFDYSYDPIVDNRNGQTLKRLSTDIPQDKMDASATFQKFLNYYGFSDYGHRWIVAAIHRTATHDFKNGDGNFYNYDDAGTAVAVRRGTVYLNLWMAVVLELEHVVHACQTPPADGTTKEDQLQHAWDRAVAMYTGSIVQQGDGQGFDGHTLYTLAANQCIFSATCTVNVEIEDRVSLATNHANVNLNIYRAFNQGQDSLLNGDCSSVKTNADYIVQQMAVPMLQGMVQLAYAMDLGYQSDDANHAFEASGAMYAAAVLPLIHFCDEQSARVIYQNMRVGNGVGTTSYDEVTKAIESNLDCLGLTCRDLGGVADVVNGDIVYLRGGEPCHWDNHQGSSSSSSSSATTTAEAQSGTTFSPPTSVTAVTVNNKDDGANVGLAVGLTIALMTATMLITIFVSRKKRTAACNTDGSNAFTTPVVMSDGGSEFC